MKLTRPVKRKIAAFLSGAARVLDIGGCVSSPYLLDDSEAIASDWAAVGQDMHKAIKGEAPE